jgi:hypothetical protein
MVNPIKNVFQTSLPRIFNFLFGLFHFKIKASVHFFVRPQGGNGKEETNRKDRDRPHEPRPR